MPSVSLPILSAYTQVGPVSGTWSAQRDSASAGNSSLSATNMPIALEPHPTTDDWLAPRRALWFVDTSGVPTGVTFTEMIVTLSWSLTVGLPRPPWVDNAGYQVVCFGLGTEAINYTTKGDLANWGVLMVRADNILANAGSQSTVPVTTSTNLVQVQFTVPATVYDAICGLRASENESSIGFAFYDEFHDRDPNSYAGSGISGELRVTGRPDLGSIELFYQFPPQVINVTPRLDRAHTVFPNTTRTIDTIQQTRVDRAHVVYVPVVTGDRILNMPLTVRSHVVYPASVAGPKLQPLMVRSHVIFAPVAEETPRVVGMTVTIPEEINLRDSDDNVKMGFVLQLAGHEPIDLTNANIVEQRFLDLDANEVRAFQPVAILNAKNGDVQFEYNADLAPGTYWIDTRITWEAGVLTSVPSGTFFAILRVHE